MSIYISFGMMPNSRKICFMTIAILFKLSYTRRTSSSFSRNFRSFSNHETLSEDRIYSNSVAYNHELRDLADSALRSVLSANFTSIPNSQNIHFFRKHLSEQVLKQSVENKDRSLSNTNSVDFMINLYNYKSGKSKVVSRNKGKLNNVLKRSDVIRCFEAVGELSVLGLETAKEPFRSSSQAATCYYQSNHSKVEAIPLSALPKDTTSESCRPISILSLFYAKRQARKL